MNPLCWLLPGFAVHALLWQLAESKLQDWAEALLARLTGRPLNQTSAQDAEGIPLQIYRDGVSRSNPLFIAAQAARDFPRGRNPARLRSFLRLTAWLANAAEESSGALWLPYHFPLPDFGLKPPWFSCLAQANTLLCFAQRHSLEPQGGWDKRCEGLLRSLDPELGLALKIGPGLWFPEYPGTPKAFVLNGMISVLLYLDEAAKLLESPQAASLFDRGYAALLEKLPEFDRRGFTLYSLDGTLASRNYHQMHCRLLKRLHALRPHPLLQKYARRWQVHDLIPVALQLFHYPRPRRVLAFLLSLAGFLALSGLIATAVCR